MTFEEETAVVEIDEEEPDYGATAKVTYVSTFLNNEEPNAKIL